MDSVNHKENLKKDRIHYLVKSLLSGGVTSIILAVVLALALRGMWWIAAD
jgi:hypothetical protein